MTSKSAWRRKRPEAIGGTLRSGAGRISVKPGYLELIMAETRIDPLAIVQYVTTSVLLVLLVALFLVLRFS
jgi:hypothetical protein